jgi:hypothetical protein
MDGSDETVSGCVEHFPHGRHNNHTVAGIMNMHPVISPSFSVLPRKKYDLPWAKQLKFHTWEIYFNLPAFSYRVDNCNF